MGKSRSVQEILRDHSSATNLCIQSNLNDALFQAVERCDYNETRALIASGADIGIRYYNVSSEPISHAGDTLLIRATRKNDLELMRLLIEKGCLVNDINELWESSLSVAVNGSFEGAIELLLSNGADPNLNVGNDWQDPPMEAAIRNGHFDLVKLLLQHGADPNGQIGYEFTCTPLELALSCKELGIAEQLLNCGAVVTEWAATEGFKSSDLLLRKRLLDCSDVRYDCYGRGTTILMCAAASGSVEATTSCILRGSDVNGVDVIGTTSLMKACEMGHLEVARTLIDDGAEVNAVDTWHRTALSFACENRLSDILELLLGRGADPNLVDRRGRSPLRICVDSRYHQGMNILLRGGADPNHIDSLGQSSLQRAVTSHYKIGIVTLIQGGADVNQINSNGNTLLLQAVKDLADGYRGKWFQIDTCHVVDLLIMSGADPTVPDSNGRTALEIVASIKAYRMPKYMKQLFVEILSSTSFSDEREWDNLIDRIFSTSKNGPKWIHPFFVSRCMMITHSIRDVILAGHFFSAVWDQYEMGHLKSRIDARLRTGCRNFTHYSDLYLSYSGIIKVLRSLEDHEEVRRLLAWVENHLRPVMVNE